MAASTLCGDGWPTTRRQGAGELARGGAPPPRLPVRRYTRCRQDHVGSNPRQGAELLGRHRSRALRHLRCVYGDRRRPLRGSHRSGCGVAHPGGRYPGIDGKHPVHAGAGAIQGLPHRRGAHADESLLQRAAQDAGGATPAYQVPVGDHGSPEVAGDGAVSLPAVQPEATDRGGDLPATGENSRGRGIRSRSRRTEGAVQSRGRQHAGWSEPAGPGHRIQRRRRDRGRGQRHARQHRPAARDPVRSGACRPGWVRIDARSLRVGRTGAGLRRRAGRTDGCPAANRGAATGRVRKR